MLADVFTPVGIYLRLRDKFRDTILLESTDVSAGENSYSIIAINAIAGIEISTRQSIEFKLPGQTPEKISIGQSMTLPDVIAGFSDRFHPSTEVPKAVKIAQGLFGYTSYDAVQFFENIKFNARQDRDDHSIPLMRYRLYQYAIVINHFKDEMFICENHFDGIDSRLSDLESIIKRKDVPAFPFAIKNAENSNITNEEYKTMVRKGIEACMRGDVFQIVLSRQFSQSFIGDEFNVYRALRSINPSPYLFYFDYGDYRLMGSSPESQVIIENGKVIVHPIAGTFKRSGNEQQDLESAKELLKDVKENAEHVMLVDLARNDLSRVCDNVEVTSFKKIHFFSHVIHLVSEVQGTVGEQKNPFTILGSTFIAKMLAEVRSRMQNMEF